MSSSLLTTFYTLTQALLKTDTRNNIYKAKTLSVYRFFLLKMYYVHSINKPWS